MHFRIITFFMQRGFSRIGLRVALPELVYDESVDIEFNVLVKDGVIPGDSAIYAEDE